MSDKRVAIVTGTSSGIGLELARQLLGRGWSVIGLARRPAALSGANYSHFSTDVGDVTALSAWLDAHLSSPVRDPAVTRIALVNNAADLALHGQVDQIDPAKMLHAYAVNTVAPVVLMGWILRTAPARVPLRIVNVSSGAGVEPFPGLGAYAATKAALRIAGMVLGAELGMRSKRDVSIWSYEPGVVETRMQVALRASSAETLPIVGVFQQLADGGKVLPVAVPAAEIVGHLEADGHPVFSEKRFLLT